MDGIKYTDVFDEAVNRFALNEKCNISFEEASKKNRCHTARLEYDGFCVLIKYGEACLEGYSFLEGSEFSKCVVTKFIFPFSETPFSVYDVHNAVDDNVFTTYDFHCLYKPEDITNALKTVFDFIIRNKIELERVNTDTEFQGRLEASFAGGLKIASKRITPQKLKDNPEKYLSSHDVDLYFLRHQNDVFCDFVYKGKRGALERFFAKESKRKRLLPFEERYLEYLFKNDFEIPNTAVSNEVKGRIKNTKKVKFASTLSVAISVFIALFIDYLFYEFIFPTAFNITPSEEGTITFDLIFYTLGIVLFIGKPIEYLLLNKKELYEKRSKKSAFWCTIIGILLILTGFVIQYFTII